MLEEDSILDSRFANIAKNSLPSLATKSFGGTTRNLFNKYWKNGFKQSKSDFIPRDSNFGDIEINSFPDFRLRWDLDSTHNKNNF